MRKTLFLLPLVMGVLTFISMNFLGYGPEKQSQAATDTVTLSATVLQYLTFSFTAGDAVAFGDVTPGTPVCFNTGTVASVTTNSANGYTLGLHDGVAAANSSMLHTDTTTRITDVTSGTLGTPAVWGTSTGVGATLFAADTGKNTTTWGTGTTVCDALNKYAAIPETATTGHTVTGYHATADTSSWGFKIDVPNTQKTGLYSGVATFTATAVLT